MHLTRVICNLHLECIPVEVEGRDEKAFENSVS